eukprot:6062700-Pleurochrysis_carterae.AAC.1
MHTRAHSYQRAQHGVRQNGSLSQCAAAALAIHSGGCRPQRACALSPARPTEPLGHCRTRCVPQRALAGIVVHVR